jgi:sirohydrochlorin cobaltochelatase
VVNRAQRFLSATLALVGHGSTKNRDSRQSIERHGAELRRRGLFGHVLECFYKEPPYVREVWDRSPDSEIFVIPVFMGEGYFTRRIIPRELGLTSDAGATIPAQTCHRRNRRLLYGRPVGTHPRMTGVVLARAEGVILEGAGAPAPSRAETALVIAGHGTTKDERSREVIDRQVETIRQLGLYAEVHAAFIEEDRHIADCYTFVQAPNLIVVPFFVSDGMHVKEDIPVLLGESEERVRQRLLHGQSAWVNPTERRGKRVWYTGSVGMEPLLAEVIVERVTELAARIPPQHRF